MNDTTPTDEAGLEQAVADKLYADGALPCGAFVDGYLVLAKVTHLDGTEEAVYFHGGIGTVSQLGLLRAVQVRLERD